MTRDEMHRVGYGVLYEEDFSTEEPSKYNQDRIFYSIKKYLDYINRNKTESAGGDGDE